MAKKNTKSRLEDFRVNTVDQLRDELTRLRKEQFNLRFQKATGQLEKTSRVGRHPPLEIARIESGARPRSRAQSQRKERRNTMPKRIMEGTGRLQQDGRRPPW